MPVACPMGWSAEGFDGHSGTVPEHASTNQLGHSVTDVALPSYGMNSNRHRERQRTANVFVDGFSAADRLAWPQDRQAGRVVTAWRKS
jgi:hypothetical protein